jgi:DNA uptake protein ComE-like DNA-binding protein
MDSENITVILKLLAMPLFLLWFFIRAFRKIGIHRSPSRINHDAKSRIMSELKISDRQAGQIVARRHVLGYFVNYRDFVARTDCFSRREYRAIKKYLDFTIHYTSTQINHASRREIMEGLWLTGGQAEQLVARRDRSGYFADYSDFVAQTGLPETQCAKFREYLDFTVNGASTQINHAGWEKVQTGLHLTNGQVQKMIDERKERGDFLDYDDFVRRTGFSDRHCARLREWLDFTATGCIPTQINNAKRRQIRRGLRLSEAQARAIVDERDANGDFLDYDDLVRRTGFSDGECARFKEWLDFIASTKIDLPQALMNDSAEISLDKIIREAETGAAKRTDAGTAKRTDAGAAKRTDANTAKKTETGTAKRTDAAGTAGKTQADSPAPLPAIKINDASETEIRERLGVTVIQAKMIVAERKARGDYLDCGDFVARSGLSERACSGFRDSLNFTVSHFSDRKQGRVLDI